MPRAGIPLVAWENALAVAFYVAVVIVPMVCMAYCVYRSAKHLEERAGLLAQAGLQLISSLAILAVAPRLFLLIEQAHDACGLYIVHSCLSQTPQSFVILGVASSVVTYFLFAREGRPSK